MRIAYRREWCWKRLLTLTRTHTCSASFLFPFHPNDQYRGVVTNQATVTHTDTRWGTRSTDVNGKEKVMSGCSGLGRNESSMHFKFRWQMSAETPKALAPNTKQSIIDLKFLEARLNEQQLIHIDIIDPQISQLNICFRFFSQRIPQSSKRADKRKISLSDAKWRCYRLAKRDYETNVESTRWIERNVDFSRLETVKSKIFDDSGFGS